MPPTGITFSADGKTATLQMSNVPMDFKIVFKAGSEPVKYEDPMRQYRFEGFRATAQLEAAFRVPSLDFTFQTDPLESSPSDFAVMGDEVNGRYYEGGSR